MSTQPINGTDRAKSRQPDQTQSARQRAEQDRPRNPQEPEPREPSDRFTGEIGHNPQDIASGTRRKTRSST